MCWTASPLPKQVQQKKELHTDIPHGMPRGTVHGATVAHLPLFNLGMQGYLTDWRETCPKMGQDCDSVPYELW